MSYIKIQIKYYGDELSSSVDSRQNMLKTATIALPKKVIEYGNKYGYDKLNVSSWCDHLIIRYESVTLMDKDINGSNDEYIRSLESYEWIESDNNSSKQYVPSNTSTNPSSTNSSSESSTPARSRKPEKGGCLSMFLFVIIAFVAVSALCKM